MKTATPDILLAADAATNRVDADRTTSAIFRRGSKFAVVVTVALVVGGCATTPADEFRAAVATNNVDQAATLLAAGGDPNSKDAGGTPLLHVALRMRSERLAQLLLARGADPNQSDVQGRSALFALSPQTEFRRSEINDGLIWIAINAATTRYVCARELSAETIGQVIARVANVNAGDKQGVTPLMQAAECGHLATITALLAAGAEVDARMPDGYRALFFAVGATRPEAARLLLERGADANARAKAELTCLMLAASRSGPDAVALVKLLLENGADSNAQDAAGDTALILAARNASGAPVVEQLLDAGATPALANKAGATAMSIAQGDVRELLSRRSPPTGPASTR